MKLYMFWTFPLSIIRDLFTVPSWSCSKAVYKPVWHLPLLRVQWINSWWWTEELSVTCRVSYQNKFVKLVRLFGSIIKKFVTMHGHMNVKFCQLLIQNSHRWSFIIYGWLMSEHQWINFSARFTDVRFLVCLVLCVMNTNSLLAVLCELLVYVHRTASLWILEVLWFLDKWSLDWISMYIITSRFSNENLNLIDSCFCD
jgi:hypothetical protein